MDAMDFISEFFGGVCTYEYTLHDAIQDSIIKRPIYCYCTYDIETDLKDAALTAGEDVNNITVKEVLKSKLVEISNIYNMPNIIKDVTAKHCRSTSYQKFIVFFANFKQMEDKKGVVEGWFQTAYPKHSIKTLTINSKDKESSENVHELDKLVRRKNGIDLIFCIDMLNMGYHVNDLTGIVMYRGTSSSTIYIQQLGRALSTGSENACIVFDVVDNLHRKASLSLLAISCCAMLRREIASSRCALASEICSENSLIVGLRITILLLAFVRFHCNLNLFPAASDTIQIYCFCFAQN